MILVQQSLECEIILRMGQCLVRWDHARWFGAELRLHRDGLEWNIGGSVCHVNASVQLWSWCSWASYTVDSAALIPLFLPAASISCIQLHSYPGTASKRCNSTKRQGTAHTIALRLECSRRSLVNLSEIGLPWTDSIILATNSYCAHWWPRNTLQVIQQQWEYRHLQLQRCLQPYQTMKMKCTMIFLKAILTITQVLRLWVIVLKKWESP